MYAVIVGIDRYENANIVPLRFAVSDASRVRDLLSARWGLVPGEHLFFFSEKTTPAADHDEVYTAIERVGARIQPEDSFLFYFSGHGKCLEKDDSHLFTANANNDSTLALRNTTLSLRALKDCMSEFNGNQIILILDACRTFPEHAKDASDEVMSDEFARDIKAMAADMKRGGGTGGPSRIGVVFACAPRQKSYEPEELGGGLFTHFLLENIRNWPEDTVPLNRLVECTRIGMEEFAKRKLPVGRQQQPWIEFSGDIPVLGRIPGRTIRERPEPVGDRTTCVAPGEEIGDSLLPKTKNDLNKDVRVGHRAQVKGRIYGVEVVIEPGAYVLGPVIAERSLEIGAEAVIDGTAVAAVRVELGGKVNGDLAAPVVEAKGKPVMNGNVLVKADFTLPQQAMVKGGILCEGNVTLQERAVAGAVSGTNISAQDGVALGLVHAQGTVTGARGITFDQIICDKDVTLGAQAKGVWIVSAGAVRLAEGAKVTGIVAAGEISLGSKAEVKFAAGEKITLGELSKAQTVVSRGTLTVGDDARIGDASVRGRIEFGQRVKVDSWTLISREDDIRLGSGLLLNNLPASEKNLFSLTKSNQLVAGRTKGGGRVLTVAIDAQVYDLLCQLHGSPLGLSNA
jgi:predicted acyltransferase (DUF342 family)